MILQLVVTAILIQSNVAKDSFDYCMPSNSTCWPTQAQWDELKGKITDGKLHDISDDSKYDEICPAFGDDAYKLEDEGQGRCMQYHDCSKKTCYEDSAWNIPEYSVEAQNENDIIEALKFANTHNIQVVVKTSGHNYAGASMGDGALLVWMRNYKKYTSNITKNHTICGEMFNATLKVGGGQVWEEAYKDVGNDYHIIGGGGLTVAAAGGWLNGGGLSASARQYGMGIDQVQDFEVILANGTKVTASKCENEDLFWALRGGGGGTFGVTTSVHYKLHSTKPFCEVVMYVSDFNEPNYDTTTVYKWIDYLVDSAPTLDSGWGGYWGFSFAIFYYEGTEADIKKDSFIAGMYALGKVYITVKCDISYFAVRGGPDNLETDKTGSAEFNIASRLIPVNFVKENPDKMKEIFKWMVNNGFHTFNYIIGGKMMDVATNATAVHPVMRQSVFQMEVFEEKMIKKLRTEFPDSGAGFNHAAKDEPDWRNQFWGSNRERLEALKKKFDPDNRFNCWHCVGYLSSAPTSAVLHSALIITAVVLLTTYF